MAPSEPNHKPFQIQGEEPHFEEELEGWGGYIEWEKVRGLGWKHGLGSFVVVPRKEETRKEGPFAV